MHYLLFYEVDEDYVRKRAQFRDLHLAKAWQASERGELVLGGALADPVDGAVLLFTGESPEVAERFARTDPYVTGGAVKRWYVREWTTVVGQDAAKPVRPGKTVTEMSGTAPLGLAGQGNGMLVRMWKGRATPNGADDYVRHATGKVFPSLRNVDGFRGAYLLRRLVGNGIEFVVLTLWDSIDAVRRFAGERHERAVVEPEARAVLSSFDDTVTHFEVVHCPKEKK